MVIVERRGWITRNRITSCKKTYVSGKSRVVARHELRGRAKTEARNEAKVIRERQARLARALRCPVNCRRRTWRGIRVSACRQRPSKLTGVSLTIGAPRRVAGLWEVKAWGRRSYYIICKCARR